MVKHQKKGAKGWNRLDRAEKLTRQMIRSVI